MIKILTNGVAVNLDQVTTFYSGGTPDPYGMIAPEFDFLDMANGPRSSKVKFIETGRGEYRVGYFSDTNQFDIDFAAIIRADLLLTLGEMTTGFRQVNSNSLEGSTTTLGTDESPIQSADLIGVDRFGKGHGQDYVQEFTTSGDQYGFFVRLDDDSAAGESAMFSKLIMGQAFSFGTDQNPVASGTLFNDIPLANSISSPLEGDEPYRIEKRFQVTWNHLTEQNIEDFLALPKIAEWPFLLYDADADLIPWKLEHVILENYSATLRSPDVWTLTLNLARLRHYE